MTPFGEKIRLLRQQKHVTQKQMAHALNVSPAYLSALEHGQRGKPQWSFVQRVITYFNIIWDEAEELQNLALISDPKPTVDTVKLSADATRLANLLAQNISSYEDGEIYRLIEIIDQPGKDVKN